MGEWVSMTWGAFRPTETLLVSSRLQHLKLFESQTSVQSRAAWVGFGHVPRRPASRDQKQGNGVVVPSKHTHTHTNTHTHTHTHTPPQRQQDKWQKQCHCGSERTREPKCTGLHAKRLALNAQLVVHVTGFRCMQFYEGQGMQAQWPSTAGHQPSRR